MPDRTHDVGSSGAFAGGQTQQNGKFFFEVDNDVGLGEFVAQSGILKRYFQYQVRICRGRVDLGSRFWSANMVSSDALRCLRHVAKCDE